MVAHLARIARFTRKGPQVLHKTVVAVISTIAQHRDFAAIGRPAGLSAIKVAGGQAANQGRINGSFLAGNGSRHDKKLAALIEEAAPIHAIHDRGNGAQVQPLFLLTFFPILIRELPDAREHHILVIGSNHSCKGDPVPIWRPRRLVDAAQHAGELARLTPRVSMSQSCFFSPSRSERNKSRRLSAAHTGLMSFLTPLVNCRGSPTAWPCSSSSSNQIAFRFSSFALS